MTTLHDDIPTRRFPAVTAILIAVNVAVFVFELTLPRYGLTQQGLFAKMGVVPYELAHGYDVPPADLVPWWATMFTALFIHGGWLRVIFTMLYLWVFGNDVEDRLGRWRFLGFYLVCGIVATALQVLVSPESTVPVIGAGGAVAGVLGAYLALHPRARAFTAFGLGIVLPVVSVPAWILLAVWFGLQAVQGVLSFGHPAVAVAFFAHVGGFVAGLALAVPLDRIGRRRYGRAGLRGDRNV